MNFFDTDMLTLFVHGHEKVTNRAAREDPFSITVISRIEILRGRFDFVMKAANANEWLRAMELLDRWDVALARQTIIAIDAAAALEFEHLLTIKSLRKIGRGDLGIAAISMAHKATLITRNIKDFKLVPGLRYENWAD